MAMNVGLQASFKRNDIRYINGEELKPPCEPQLYGGEVVVGGPRPGHADVAGQTVPDDVTKNVILGNQYAKLNWQTDSHTLDPVGELERRKAAFNEGRPADEQSQNWTIGGIGGFAIKREETPQEARARMAKDPAAYEDNNYHSGVLHSAENHRWVTAMDVAIGQAVTLDDPVWRELLILMAGWKIDDRAKDKILANKNYHRLSDESKLLLDACWDYYSSGVFPDALVSNVPPDLVTRELTPKAEAAQRQTTAAQREREQRAYESEQHFYQDQMARNWGNWGSVR